MKKWLILILLISLYGCEAKLSKLPQDLDFETEPDLKVKNFRMWYKMDSKLRAEAWAPILNKYTRKKHQTVFPEGIKIKFYDENITEKAFLQADYAVEYTNKNLWKFEKNVLIKNPQGSYLKTQELYFDATKKKLYSVKYVEVVNSDGTQIRGKGGFEANLDFTEYRFKNVDGIVNYYKNLQ